ncbi:MAG TPA: energy transducer TonB [Acidimicrobiaceae bacterium]|nr:energy transducer TonB [Acidimicrobiaceae bacterium]
MRTILMKYKIALVALIAASSLFAQPLLAEEAAPAAGDLEVVKASSLDELLDNVEQRRVVESREHTARERKFAAEKANQAKMLQDAKAERRREQRRSDRLETTFEENEIRIGDLQEQLDKRLGSLRELFGVLQQVAGDTRGLFEGSLISSQYPNRGEFLGDLAKKMGTSSQLASIDEMESLWFELQREMTESGKISRYPGTITRLSGDKDNTDIVRVGSFALLGGGEYLQWNVDTQTITEIARQPSGRHTSTAADLQDAQPGEVVEFSVDPTRGSLLALLIQAATLGERVGSITSGFTDGQGGIIGAIIIWVGIIALLVALERVVTLFATTKKVNAQRGSSTANRDNPLGRVLSVYEENKDVDVETLELKMGEAILGETPELTKRISFIQVISVVAPLAGLLGTVIGMIETFQAITLFGTGDPKTMAGGISTALMTTVLGITVAIPTTLLHQFVQGLSKDVLHIIEEQSAGLIAEHAEKSGNPIG